MRAPGTPVDPYDSQRERGQTTKIPSLDDYDEWTIYNGE